MNFTFLETALNKNVQHKQKYVLCAFTQRKFILWESIATFQEGSLYKKHAEVLAASPSMGFCQAPCKMASLIAFIAGSS